MAQNGATKNFSFFLALVWLNLHNPKAFLWFQIAFSTKPVLHGGLEGADRDPVTGFEQAVGYGERIVEDCIVRKVAHGEAVEPLQGARGDDAGVSAALNIGAFYAQLPDKHTGIEYKG